MGGDHAGALGLLIGGVMLLMAVGSVAVAWLAGWGVARLLGAPPKTRRVAGLMTGALGLLVGLAMIASTFFVNSWSPPVLLDLRVPADFAHETVILLEDPTISDANQSTGGGLPFSQRRITLAVPASGVVRVADFGPFLRDGTYPPQVRMSNHPDHNYYADANPPPKGDRATQLMYIVSMDAPYETRFALQDPAVSAQMIRERTGR